MSEEDLERRVAAILARAHDGSAPLGYAGIRKLVIDAARIGQDAERDACAAAMDLLASTEAKQAEATPTRSTVTIATARLRQRAFLDAARTLRGRAPR